MALQFRTFKAASSGMTIPQVTALIKGTVRALVAAPPDFIAGLRADAARKAAIKAAQTRPTPAKAREDRTRNVVAALRAGIREVK